MTFENKFASKLPLKLDLNLQPMYDPCLHEEGGHGTLMAIGNQLLYSIFIHLPSRQIFIKLPDLDYLFIKSS